MRLRFFARVLPVARLDKIVSICNTYSAKTALPVTDQDKPVLSLGFISICNI